jgi:hypothetical protein
MAVVPGIRRPTKGSLLLSPRRGRRWSRCRLRLALRIWNPVPLVHGSTRWYVLVLAVTYLSGYKAVQGTSKWYIPVRTNIGNSYGSTYRYVLVCTALYLHSTRWYKVVQGGPRWYKVVQKTVYEGIWRYKAVRESFKSYRLVRTGMH